MNRQGKNVRQFNTDAEGPVTKNDNAYEVCCEFIPGGDRFFSIVSRYDDVLADLVKRAGYRAGDTLRLILPFLKAYGVTNELLETYARETLLLVPGAEDTLRYLAGRMPAFIVSTSYEHYVRAVCELLSFPFERAYCTRLDLDRYTVQGAETQELKKLCQQIAQMPMIEIPDEATSLDDLSERHRETVQRLDGIFWSEMVNMSSYKIIEEVNPIGGQEKAEAILDSLKRTGSDISDVMYVGDSITDVEAFDLVRRGGGLAVSFNGNSYAIRATEIAVMSSHSVVTSILASVFSQFGKERTIELADNWSYHHLAATGDVDEELLERLAALCDGPQIPRVEILDDGNRDRLAEESSLFRKTVRGERIGTLG